jgi:uncharacterized repeat protein (TIGR03837 family)
MDAIVAFSRPPFSMTAKPLDSLRWDIFCQVIDNFGDLGVCWRLACNLAGRGQRVRLWVDEPKALRWMAPSPVPGIEVRTWTTPLALGDVVPGDVLIEAFGCTVDPDFLTLHAKSQAGNTQLGQWINLEYLSAQSYVERSHGLHSPVMSGPGAGLSKRFFYPGFTLRTGGLLREPDLLAQQSRFDRKTWLGQHLAQWQADEQLISLFCYEPPVLASWLATIALQEVPTRLAVSSGRASQAVKSAIHRLDSSQAGWNSTQRLRVSFLPLLSQHEFDHLLWASDFNFVRGEDSWVRSLWAGKPAIWQIYPQADGAHADKLQAYLDLLQAPADLCQFHRIWNGLEQAPLVQLDFKAWGKLIRQLRDQLMVQPDLCSQLLEFVASHPR